MHSELKRLREAISAATQGAHEQDLAWRPAEGKWCAAEVLEHLYLTYTGTIKGCERCLDANRPLATSATWKQRLGVALIMGTGRMPYGRQAPERTRPRGLPGVTVQADFESKLSRMDELLTQCEARYGSKVKILDHPVLGPLTVGQWRKFHRIHGLHHARQLAVLRRKRQR